MASKTQTGTIRQKVFVKASPEEVYDAFVDSRKHSAFTGSRATGAPRVGARITAWDGYISGRNLKLVKGKMIVQEWRTTEWPRGYSSSKLELSFKRKGNGTELQMVHSNVPRSQVAEYRSGWYESYWEPLRRYFREQERRSPKKLR